MITKYELHPAIGVKVSKFVSLADDLALALAAKDIRIEAPIPGKALVGTDSTFLGLGLVFFSGGMLTVGSATTGVGSGIGSCDAGAFLSELGSTSFVRSDRLLSVSLLTSRGWGLVYLSDLL